MRILQIESETNSIKRLDDLIGELLPSAEIVGRCRSVQEGIKWFREHHIPDLVIAAIQLPDGLSFEIFRKLRSKPPVVFTCRYGKYAFEAFKLGGVHYLPKPVKKKELQNALTRYEQKVPATVTAPRQSSTQARTGRYPARFIVHQGKQMRLVSVEEIAYFFTENKVVYQVTAAGEKYATDFTLEELEKILNPKIFFRANRQFITNISSIVKMTPASKSRLKLSLKPESRHEIITSFERTAAFRNWLTGSSYFD